MNTASEIPSVIIVVDFVDWVGGEVAVIVAEVLLKILWPTAVEKL